MSVSDYIRLNLADINDLPLMIVNKSKELLGIDISELSINIRYDATVSNSHGCPINGVTNWGGMIENHPRNYPGWYGSIGYFAKSKNNKNRWDGSPFLTPYSQGSYFRGFHLGGGCPGRLNEYRTDSSFYFFIDDFPVLKQEINKKIEKIKFLNTFSDKKEILNLDLKY